MLRQSPIARAIQHSYKQTRDFLEQNVAASETLKTKWASSECGFGSLSSIVYRLMYDRDIQVQGMSVELFVVYSYSYVFMYVCMYVELEYIYSIINLLVTESYHIELFVQLLYLYGGDVSLIMRGLYSSSVLVRSLTVSFWESVSSCSVTQFLNRHLSCMDKMTFDRYVIICMYVCMYVVVL